MEKARVLQNNVCFIDYAEAFVWITAVEIFKEIGLADHLPYVPAKKLVCRSRSNSYTWTWKY